MPLGWRAVKKEKLREFVSGYRHFYYVFLFWREIVISPEERITKAVIKVFFKALSRFRKEI